MSYLKKTKKKQFTHLNNTLLMILVKDFIFYHTSKPLGGHLPSLPPSSILSMITVVADKNPLLSTPNQLK